MGFYPKMRSDCLQNIVSEINSILGGTYLTTNYIPQKRLYELKQTEIGKKKNKYKFLCTEGFIEYAEMFHYLNGILMGIKAIKEKE